MLGFYIIQFIVALGLMVALFVIFRINHVTSGPASNCAPNVTNSSEVVVKTNGTLISDFRIPPYIRFIGFKSALLEYYYKADAFVRTFLRSKGWKWS